jgi:hypothetical protein
MNTMLYRHTKKDFQLDWGCDGLDFERYYPQPGI